MSNISRSYIFIFVSIFLGVITGLYQQPIVSKTAEVIASLLMNFLKCITAPIIFLSIFSTILGMNGFGEMKILGRKVFKYTILTTLLAASIALILFLGVNPAHMESIQDVEWDQASVQQASYISFFLNIVPSNLIQVFLENNVMGIVFIAFLFGAAAHKIPDENKQMLHHFFSSAFKLILKVAGLVVFIMPLGIWAFVTLFMGDIQNNSSQFSSIMLYLGVVLGANFLQGIVVIPLMLKFKGIAPLRIFKGASKALFLAFFSKSSNATLPVTLECAEKTLGIHAKTAHFSLPLCTTINMNGCAAFILTTVLFVSTVHGWTFSIWELGLWVVLATLAAIGNAGVPMGCFFLSSAFLIAMGVPIKMLGIILPFYAFLDMVETALNVWSDIAVTAIVDKELKQEASNKLLA
ncbi:MAG: dicarboxylate/amino acid:cation symporter [Simkania sp.]|nr:dicarboxylate/amino acid:cation symporter [Simkania sp.]